MRALIDTCVVLDYIKKREPNPEYAMFLFECIARKELNGYITAKSITDIYYQLHHYTHSDKEARKILNELLSFIELLGTKSEDVLRALSSKTKDYEDAVMIETAIREKIDFIVTSNLKDYKECPIPIHSAKDCLEIIHTS